MTVLDRHLAARCAATLAVVWPTLAALIVLSQAARLGHRLIGASATVSEMASILIWAFLLAAVAAGPIAVALATTIALVQLRISGEIDAYRAAGAFRTRLFAGPLIVGIVVALISETIVTTAPMAGNRLRRQLGTLLVRAAAARGAQGALTTFDDALIARRGGAIVIHRPPFTLAAARHQMQTDGNALSIDLENGQAHWANLVSAPFRVLHTTVDLGGEMDPQVRFVEKSLADAILWSPALAVVSCALALAAPIALPVQATLLGATIALHAALKTRFWAMLLAAAISVGAVWLLQSRRLFNRKRRGDGGKS